MDSIAQANFTPLTHAVSLGDDQTVQFLLETGSDPNQQDPRGRSALNIAIENGHLKSASYLLEYGAKVDLRDGAGVTPLESVRTSGDPEFIRLISGTVEVAKPKEVKAAAAAKPAVIGVRRDLRHVRTAILYIIGISLAIGCVDLKLTFKERASQNIVDAINSDDVVQVGKLITSGISANVVDLNGNSAISYAAITGKTDVVRLLLSNHADPNLGTQRGITMLQPAGLEHSEIIQNLLDSGANPNRTDSTGRALISYASDSDRHLQIITELLKHRANPNVPGLNGPPLVSLIEATNGRSLGSISELLSAGADPNAVDDAQTPIVVWSSEYAPVEVVSALIKAGANQFARDQIDRNVLHAACSKERTEVAKTLIKAGADVNAEDAGGNTPLMYAVCGIIESSTLTEEDALSTVRILREHGANINKKNRSGKTARMLAKEHGYSRLASALSG